MSNIVLIIIIVILLVLLFFRHAKIGKNLNNKNILWDIILIVSLFFLSAYMLTEYNIFNKKIVITYIFAIKEMLQIIAFFTIVLFFTYILTSFFGKKYSLRVDNFNFGGINVIFDKSSQIFIKTVGTYISSKRSLFKFNKKRDNIFEVLNAYYDVYNFIRKNLELLDSEKNKELYDTSFDILQHINAFLTKHQNDYRRWYNKVISENKVILKNGNKIIVHQTTIESVQKNYYRYREILADIKELNQYMSDPKITEILAINTRYWRN